MKLIATILLAASLQASTITQTLTIGNPDISGSSIHFSGVFSLNPFDDSLGTLDSVTLSLSPFGSLIQDVTYPRADMGGTLDYVTWGTLSFMGLTKSIYTANPSYGCGDLNSCAQFGSMNPWNTPTSITATLTPDLSTFRDYRYSYGYETLATRPGDLSMFFGEQVLFPVDLNLVARTVQSSSSILRPVQEGTGLRLIVNENYTENAPTLFRVSEIVTTPEPNYLIGMIITLSLVGLWKWRRRDKEVTWGTRHTEECDMLLHSYQEPCSCGLLEKQMEASRK